MQDKPDTTAGAGSKSRSRAGTEPGQSSSQSGAGGTFVGTTAEAARSQGAGNTSSGGLTEQARNTLTNAAAQAGDKVTSRLDQQKDRAAEGLGSVAQALRQTGDQLRDQDQGLGLQGYMASAADQVERFSGYLRSTNTREMLQGVERFAREQPALFLGSAFMLGLLATRFLKSSARDTTGQYGSPSRSESLGPKAASTGTSQYGGASPYGGTSPYGTNPYTGTSPYAGSAGSPGQPTATPDAGSGTLGRRGTEER